MAESFDAAGLGRFVRKRRRELNWTQTELANHLGCAQERISTLECGKYGLPSLHMLVLLADVLQVPRAELLAAAGFEVRAEETASNGTERDTINLRDVGELVIGNITLMEQLGTVYQRMASLESQMHVAEDLVVSLRQRRQELKNLTEALRAEHGEEVPS